MPRIDGPRLNRVRILLWTAVAMVSAAAAVAALILWRDPPRGAGVAEDYASAFGGPFSLVDPQGRTITEQSLRGKPFAIFFGFTHCPDVCPTTLQSMVRLRAQLGADAERLNIVFVSVDPERDTPAEIGHYLTMFDAPIIGLTGTPAQLARIVDAYHVFYEKVPLEGGDYVIDHTATVFLMDAVGGFAGTLAHDEGEAPKLAKLRRLVRS